MRPTPRRIARTTVAAGCVVAASGCNAILGSSGYYETRAEPVDAGATPDASVETEGGLPDALAPIDACAPATDRRSLELACTSSSCVPYASVLPACDGGLCPLLAPTLADAGAAPVTDAGDASAASDAGTTNPCSHVAADPGSIVYVTGSTALAGFIDEVSSALASKVTIVYQPSGSCVGVRAALDPGDNVLSSLNGPATYYTPDGTQRTCTLDPGERLVADIGASDVFYSTCYLGQAAQPALPASVAENFGPVQIMNFAVPQSSSQQSISLSAAYYVFGFGGLTYPVSPWTDPAQLQIRTANSGTQSLIAAAIGVPPDAWRGISHATSAQVGAALVAAGQSGTQSVVDSAMGILASDYLLQNLQTLRGLAVKDENASCGYFPSSTAFARDDANARDGHYPLWGPSHFYARVDPSTKLPSKDGVSAFIDGLSGLAAVPGLDLVAEYASKGLVPECAMHVTRVNDGGDYGPFKSPVTCNCYFDLHATGATHCQACQTSSDCPSSAPSCNKFGPPPQKGYCDL